MKCDELTPIDLECNFGKDINGVEHREPWKAYDIDEVKAAIAELKEFAEDACLERDDNQTAIDELQSENRKLKEERRWRKCSDEMPQNYDDGDYFLIAVEHESTTIPKRYCVTLAELVGGCWVDEEGRDIDEDIEYDLENSILRSQAPQGTKKGFYRSKVTHWMPIPSAPKEVE